MKRRNFVQLLGTGAASALVMGSRAGNDNKSLNPPKELGRHKIMDVRFTTVDLS